MIWNVGGFSELVDSNLSLNLLYSTSKAARAVGVWRGHLRATGELRIDGKRGCWDAEYSALMQYFPFVIATVFHLHSIRRLTEIKYDVIDVIF